MPDSDQKIMSMGKIIAIMVGVALVLGLLIGGLGGLAGLPPGITGAGIGAAVGLIGVLLLNKRKAALAARNQGR